EAARIDGATSWNVFRYITLPLLKPTIVFALVMTTIWNLQIFDTIYVVTSGGPGFSTYSVVYYIYQNALTLYGAGRAATMSFLLLVMIFAVVGVQLILLREGGEDRSTEQRRRRFGLVRIPAGRH